MKTLKGLRGATMPAALIAVIGSGLLVSGLCTASASGALEVSYSVPVVHCATIYGVTPTAQPNSATTAPASLAAGVAAKLAYYTDKQGLVPDILGPRNWQCRALVSATGSFTIQVYPPGQGGSSKAWWISAPPKSSVNGSNGDACPVCMNDLVCKVDPAFNKAVHAGAQGCDDPWIPWDTRLRIRDVHSSRPSEQVFSYTQSAPTSRNWSGFSVASGESAVVASPNVFVTAV